MRHSCFSHRVSALLYERYQGADSVPDAESFMAQHAAAAGAAPDEGEVAELARQRADEREIQRTGRTFRDKSGATIGAPDDDAPAGEPSPGGGAGAA